MQYLVGRLHVFHLLLLVLVFVFLPLGARAEDIDVSGRYECSTAKLAGKTVKCMPTTLTLKHDGRFELRGWEGTYLVAGDWVEMSDSLVKTRAKIRPGHKIVLRYHGKHGIVEMTFERRVAELGKIFLT
jgi:hypothetical protein